MEKNDTTLRQAQQQVHNWITTYGGNYFSPLTNMAILAEETGEVARVMARQFGDQVAKPTDKHDLADELADVMWVVMAIANQTGIDLQSAFDNNIAKKTARDNQRFVKTENQQNNNIKS